ncbi:hypothetical protein ROA7450_03604 [Roseovarius albus]|uniref:Cupin domain protein n=1 Tax=Roseovarius albus TaxID=1247867 RepID=A0A1X7A1I9_9RHOB|nr:dimethylsulfonioproprionate lyase family protein [Roseovarius albus]SLN67419.1 hypothetical protein ROA7450_03604 [Roseovarius albus]
MTQSAALHTLLDAAKAWHSALPALSEFVHWPQDLTYTERPPHALPHIAHLTAEPGVASAVSTPLRDAIITAAPYIEWRHTYTEEEVGRDFLNRFGWFELAGPDGHFITNEARLTVGFWGANLHYDWHQHEPEELYSVVSGHGQFMIEDQDTLTLGPEGTRLHLSNQPHALTTTDATILTFVLWRGAGLADPPRMSP